MKENISLIAHIVEEICGIPTIKPPLILTKSTFSSNAFVIFLVECILHLELVHFHFECKHIFSLNAYIFSYRVIAFAFFLQMNVYFYFE